MGVRRMGQRSSVNLNQLVDRFVGLKYIGIAQNVTLDIPANKATGEKARKDTADRVRALLVEFSDDGANMVVHGEILVLQTLVARELEADQENWLVGVFQRTTQIGDASRTVYSLGAPSENPEAAFDLAEAGLRAAGLV